MSKIDPFLSKSNRLDAAILSPYSQPAFERVARRYAFGPKAWMLQNFGGIVVAILLFAGGLAMMALAANQSLLDAYGARTIGIIKKVSFHTDTFGRRTHWKTVVYEFTTEQGSMIKTKLDRPVQEMSSVPNHGNLAVVYWERFPAINALRGLDRGVVALIIIGLLFLFGSFHFVCFVRRGIRWRRSLIAASATALSDQRGQLPHVVKNGDGARRA